MYDVLGEGTPEELQKFEKKYHEKLYKCEVTPDIQFEYAWCLVRSKYPADIKKGILLLQELYKTHEEGQRDYLYYLAIGTARIKEYCTALEYVRVFLCSEPRNQQVLYLKSLIKKQKMKQKLSGAAVVGGIVLGLGALVAAGGALIIPGIKF